MDYRSHVIHYSFCSTMISFTDLLTKNKPELVVTLYFVHHDSQIQTTELILHYQQSLTQLLLKRLRWSSSCDRLDPIFMTSRFI